MKTIAHLLEDFSATADTDSAIRNLKEEELEDIRLSAFEQGYSAGWEDAAKAQGEDHARLSETLARSLEDLSFTYHEAVAHLTVAVEPVFRAIVETALPTIMKQGFGETILAELQNMAAQGLAQPVIITVPPGSAAAILPMIPDRLSMPVQVVEDSALGPGQADLRIGSREREIDSNRFTEAAREAAEAFFHQAEMEANHG